MSVAGTSRITIEPGRAKVYLYVIGASSNPDAIECCVPWKIDEDEIFFGPCKKSLRQELRDRLLDKEDRAAPAEDIYFAGFNALPNSHVRKLVWAGRLIEAMSFARAWLDFSTDERYSKMLGNPKTPLHVRPIDDDESGRPSAYRHHGREHEEDMEWVEDVVTKAGRKIVQIEADDTVRLPPGTSWWEGFGLDICFRFKNIFFATEGGREIDDALVDILKEAQPDRQKGVDNVAVFGLNQAGKPDGRRGGYLELSEDLADRFVAWLREERQGDPVAPYTAVRSHRGGCWVPRRRKRGGAKPTCRVLGMGEI